MLQTPGATIALLTNAHGLRVQLDYVDGCRTSCVGAHPQCYTPLRQCRASGAGEAPARSHGCSTVRSEVFCRKHKKVKCGGVCRNHCEVKVYVDGTRQPLPKATSAREVFDGLLTLELLALPEDRDGYERKLELVLPWGGQVRLASIHLLEGSAPLSVRRAPRPHDGFTYLAYGDSITPGAMSKALAPPLRPEWPRCLACARRRILAVAKSCSSMANWPMRARMSHAFVDAGTACAPTRRTPS